MLVFLLKPSECDLIDTTQNGLEVIDFSGTLEKVSYSDNDINISIGNNKCITSGLKIKKINVPIVVVIVQNQGFNIHSIYKIYQYKDLKDLFTKWYGKSVEVFVYNSVSSEDVSDEIKNSLNQSSKKSKFILNILKNKFLGGSIFNKSLINIFGVYPVVNIKVYE